ncbi:MAG TPA: 30s ribosomal protein S12 methylthiotransferase accessory protein YcaO, partial [Thauera sp.]|nr:30s ribosomal protein S12 methylthiotransferase accessory protein YcaO [Thauera sp.]
NNSIGNALREAVLNLTDLDDEECADLLDTLNDSSLADERPVAALIGLAPGSDPFWSDLRVGELKTLLALAIGDVEAIIEGCEWVRQFNQLDADRRRVYRCIEALVRLDEYSEDSSGFEPALLALHGEATLAQATALLDGELRFFNQPSPGLDLVGCEMHERLLAAYAKLQALK